MRERAERIYGKYGTMMLNTEGMTPEGVERKATCSALFSKLLYLTEHEPLIAQGSDAFAVADLRTVRHMHVTHPQAHTQPAPCCMHDAPSCGIRAG